VYAEWQAINFETKGIFLDLRGIVVRFPLGAGHFSRLQSIHTGSRGNATSNLLLFPLEGKTAVAWNCPR